MRSTPTVEGLVADRAVEGADAHCAAELQNSLDALVEARLADEVRRLALALAESGRRFQAIRKGAAGAELGKLVAVTLELIALQISNLFFQLGNSPGSLDEYCEKLGELGLGIDDVFRELTLDGRKFLCVALIDQPANDLPGSVEGGDNCRPL